MELFILLAPALSELWSSLIDCSHSCGKFLVMNESRKKSRMNEFIFMERVLVASPQKYQSVRFANKIKSISAKKRSKSISHLQSINFHQKLIQSKQSDSYLSEKNKIELKMGQTGRWKIKFRFPVTKEVRRRRFMGLRWLRWVAALVSFALQTLSHLKARLKPFCNHLLVDLLTN